MPGTVLACQVQCCIAHIGSAPLCHCPVQEYFMDLYLLAELKTVALKITTVDMLKPPPDFRCHLIFARVSTTSPLPVCPPIPFPLQVCLPTHLCQSVHPTSNRQLTSASLSTTSPLSVCPPPHLCQSVHHTPLCQSVHHTTSASLSTTHLCQSVHHLNSASLLSSSPLPVCLPPYL